MYRNRSVILLCLLALTGPVLGDRDQAVSGYLERHGLNQLLALHLEDQIDRSLGSPPLDTLMQLAQVYVELLEKEADADRRRHLEERARRLIGMTDAEGSEQLRLALYRATYRSAEAIAERYRLRMSSEAELQRAQQSFAEIVPELHRFDRHLGSEIQVLENRLNRARGAGVTTISNRLERLRSSHQQTKFVLAWSLYYDAWLGGNESSAAEAERVFARLLLADNPRPQPSDISQDLRATEAFARAILGMALCKSITASSATALRWLDLLSGENTHESIRNQSEVWRLVILLEAREFREVQSMYEGHRESGEPFPLMWLRLVATRTLEAPQMSAEARRLLHRCIADMAAMGELSHVLDLAERYGTHLLGDSGFAIRFINGLLVYREARTLHNGDEPSEDVTVNDLYSDAIDEFSAALNEHDVAEHREAAIACRNLLAWAYFYSGAYVQASLEFERLEQIVAEQEAPEMLWMAIVSYDRLFQDETSNEHARHQAMLIERFLERYPQAEYATSLRLRQALSAERIDRNTLNELLHISNDQVSYVTARRRAAQELYQRFRASTGDERADYGNQYLLVITELLMRAVDDSALHGFVLDIRRTLEVALSNEIQALDVASRALERREWLIAEDRLDEEANAAEFTFRRVQERLLAGDMPAAFELAEALWQEDQQSIWARLAARAMFVTAREQRDSMDEYALFVMGRFGGRVLREYEDNPDALRDRRVLSYHAAVADSLFLLWKRGDGEQQGRAALFLYQRLLQVEPHNATFLRSAAILSSAFGNDRFAADCWRRLGAGHRPATEPWYEARTELLTVLERVNPPRAREVLQQHLQLYPEYGPQPWGPRIREIEQRLNAEGDANAP